jgi:phenylacetate-coenzyme A ligase PaaK-like adenylate-forming protein
MGDNIMQKDFWDSEIETKSLTELKELQLKRLKKLITYVYKNNKYYNNKFKDLNIQPDDIKKLKDIEKLPFLTKQDLRNFYPFGLVCTQMDEIVEVHASSGTTGKPVVGPYTKNDIELWAEVWLVLFMQTVFVKMIECKMHMDMVFLPVLMVLKKVHKRLEQWLLLLAQEILSVRLIL